MSVPSLHLLKKGSETYQKWTLSLEQFITDVLSQGQEKILCNILFSLIYSFVISHDI